MLAVRLVTIRTRCAVVNIYNGQELRSSGLLLSEQWYLLIDVSLQPVGPFLLLNSRPWRWDRQIAPKRRQVFAATRWVTAQKRAVLNYFAAEAWCGSDVPDTVQMYRTLWQSEDLCLSEYGTCVGLIAEKSVASEVKWGEVKWSEVEWSEVKWSGVKWGEVMWSGVKWGEL